MVELDFGGVKEAVITRNEFPVDKARKILKNEIIATLGYDKVRNFQ
jgi:ketol-acid reductoisomerase